MSWQVLEADCVEDSATGCWVWQKARHNGYGYKSVGNGVRRMGFAHRLYYEDLVGPIPEGLDLDHLCRNRACVNPGHLEPVTRRENVWRSAVAKLTKEQIRHIRRTGLTAREVHERFGIDKAHAWRIVSRRAWVGIE